MERGIVLENVPYIAIEGPIGVGKTTLARAIARNFNFLCYEEVVEDHPFLKAFYENIEQTAFQTEMFFLTDRFQQLEHIKQHYDSGQPIVADYHVFKNKLFAKQTLKPHHYEKFSKVYEILTEGLPQPNMVIYLKASITVLLERINKRNRAAEEHLAIDYLVRLAKAYEEWMPAFTQSHPDVTVLTLETDHLNLVDNPNDLSQTLQMIQESLKQGV